MNEPSIERIRNAEFPLAMRGYDRAEVDRFLVEVADWLATGEGEDEAAVEAVRRELERVGEQTASILTEAHAAAQEIRDDAERRIRQQLVDANATAERLRSEADEYAGQAREEADAYARKVRADADAYAEGSRAEVDAELEDERAAAEQEAERTVADAARRKADVETLISDLERRRDAVLAELNRLASGIAGAASRYRGSRARTGDEGTGPDADPPAVGDADETAALARDPD